MNKMTKSRDSKSNENRKYHVTVEEFINLYNYMKELDAACLALLHDEASYDQYIDTEVNHMVEEIEDIQRKVLIKMMAMNVNLKLKSGTIDRYLAHKVYVLGL